MAHWFRESRNESELAFLREGLAPVLDNRPLQAKPKIECDNPIQRQMNEKETTKWQEYSNLRLAFKWRVSSVFVSARVSEFGWVSWKVSTDLFTECGYYFSLSYETRLVTYYFQRIILPPRALQENPTLLDCSIAAQMDRYGSLTSSTNIFSCETQQGVFVRHLSFVLARSVGPSFRHASFSMKTITRNNLQAKEAHPLLKGTFQHTHTY